MWEPFAPQQWQAQQQHQHWQAQQQQQWQAEQQWLVEQQWLAQQRQLVSQQMAQQRVAWQYHSAHEQCQWPQPPHGPLQGAPVTHPPTQFRRQVMNRRQYEAIAPEQECFRCGMTQAEHTPLRGSLNKHHAVPVRDGGSSDPSNLLTLCHYCHREWHTWWEDNYEWQAYMAAKPYCQTVKDGTNGVTEGVPHRHRCCRRCGISAERCLELRPESRPLKPFRRKDGSLNEHICYWCTREWSIFWKDLSNSDEQRFFNAAPFVPME